MTYTKFSLRQYSALLSPLLCQERTCAFRFFLLIIFFCKDQTEIPSVQDGVGWGFTTNHHSLFYEKPHQLVVVATKKKVDVANLEAFVFPVNLKHAKIIKDAHEIAFQVPFSTQFQLEYFSLPTEDNERLRLSLIHDMLKDKPTTNLAVEFSSLILNSNRYYLEVKIHTMSRIVPIPNSSTFFFEYEWCSTRKLVYPIRTNDYSVPVYPIDSPEILRFKARYSPTIRIPALRCPLQ